MSDGDGKFWNGLILGGLIFGRKKNGEQEGCLSRIFYTALGLLSLMVALVVGHNNFKRGVITFFVFPIVCGIVIRIVALILKKSGLFVFDKIKTKVMAKDIAESEIAELYKSGQYTLALEKAEPLAERSPLAADVAGLCYFNGDGCSQDYSKAFSYFSMGKDKNVEAAYNYGTMLLYGVGCEKDENKGFEVVKKVALSGEYEAARADYGYALFKGTGCEINQAEGIKQLRIASDSGNMDAKAFLGRILYSGEDGTQVDENGGRRLLLESAEAGNLNAKEFIEELGMA